jgi:hypothetical protein
MISIMDPVVHRPVIYWSREVSVPILDEARRRVRIRMLSGRGHASADDAKSLTDEMLRATEDLFHPTVGQTELTVSCCRADLVIISGAMIPSGPWAGHLYDGDSLLLYCLSAGATRAELWRACDDDPVLAAAAHLLGSEISFAITRWFDRNLRKQSPRNPWQKIALLSSESPQTERCPWDPKVGHAFFTTFTGQESPVFITESGSFDPVHTVLGLFRRNVRHP